MLKLVLEFLFLTLLCIASILDIKYRRIPNYIVIAMMFIGAVALVGSCFSLEHIIGFIFPAIVLWAFSKSHHIGFGDIKLIMAVGLYYGYLPTSIILICAMLLTSCYGLFCKHKERLELKTVPFAPFVAIFCLIASALL